MVEIKRGDVILCDLNPVIGTEQAGIRPVVVLQIDPANSISPHTIIAPFTSNTNLKKECDRWVGARQCRAHRGCLKSGLL